jgi:2-iminobutanoate/2-iminopropanoate deaminase
MNRKYIIDTGKAPRAVGPFSQAVGYNGLLYVSGQTAIDTHTGKVSRAGIETQTRTVLEHISGVLNGAGLDFSHILHVTIYLRNLNDFDLVDSVYSLYCDHASPARSVVEVSRLPDDALIQMDCVAAAPTNYEDIVEDPEEASVEVPVVDEAVAETSSPEEAFETKPESALDRPSAGQEVSPEEATLSAEEGVEAIQDASHVDPKSATLAGGWSPLNKIPAPKLPGSSNGKDDETEG